MSRRKYNTPYRTFRTKVTHERNFLYTRSGSGVTWFAGLGGGKQGPWRFTDTIAEAKSFTNPLEMGRVKDSVERHTDLAWEVIPTKEAVHVADKRCATCALGWTHEEAALIKSEATPMEVEASLKADRLVIGSPMFGPEAESFRAKVLLSGVCPSCGVTLCGACMPKKAGRNAHRCSECKPVRGKR